MVVLKILFSILSCAILLFVMYRLGLVLCLLGIVLCCTLDTPTEIYMSGARPTGDNNRILITLKNPNAKRFYEKKQVDVIFNMLTQVRVLSHILAYFLFQILKLKNVLKLKITCEGTGEER